MKTISLLILVVFFSVGFCTARAEDPICFWMKDRQNIPSGIEHIDYKVGLISSLYLKMVNVGEVMGSATSNIGVVGEASSPYFKCRHPQVITILRKYELPQSSALQLENGYRDVYKTALKGVGVRLKMTQGVSILSVPGVFSSANYPAIVGQAASSLTYEFVRTAQGVESGALNLDFVISGKINDWHALSITGNNTTQLVAQSYFSGCVGTQKDIKVPMGKIWSGDLPSNTRTETFSLDVRCSGLRAGTKLPVKAYFEGDSSGPGRLELRSGGATGVEILLRGGPGAGVALPFYKSQAIEMTWQGTDTEGELYTLPITARYAKKANTKVVPGRADAVLNYIIEYN